MNSTIEYYNSHAEEYFERTSQVEFDGIYEKFLGYIPEHGRIMDIGCGSGRDIRWFRDNGYDAYGLDASGQIAKAARDKLQVPVVIGTAGDWIADEPYDGIWCCASLMHLEDDELGRFFHNLKVNLKPRGALFMSVKSGIETGYDEAGRYFRNFTEEDINKLISNAEGLKLEEIWYTEDKLSRDSFKWLNAIAVMT